MILGVYFLGQNIYFTTNPSPYWWRGIKADASILFLTSGIGLFLFMPRDGKILGAIALAIGILLVFTSSRVILNPTSLWQFFASITSLFVGYKLFAKGRI